MFFQKNKKANSLKEERCLKDMKKKGIIIFSEGDIGDSMFVILSGTINITKLVTPNNQEKNTSLAKPKHTVIAKLELGSIFGEIGMLTGKTRTTYAITGSPLVILMEINQKGMYSFNYAIQNKFNAQLISTLISRLNAINKKFVNLKEENIKMKILLEGL